MANPKHILIVEGESDKSFFDEFCREYNLDSNVTIAPPKSLEAGTHNSKQGVINILPTYLRQLADGQLEKLGVVVDADNIEHGSGFSATLSVFSEIVSEFGFVAPEAVAGEGMLFKHNDGLADFGLWIMPNNAGDGMLEHWISQCIAGEEQELYRLATTTVGGLPSPKFRPVHKIKAEIATWLAWQEKPGAGLYYAVRSSLFNERAPLHSALLKWLEHVYQ